MTGRVRSAASLVALGLLMAGCMQSHGACMKVAQGEDGIVERDEQPELPWTEVEALATEASADDRAGWWPATQRLGGIAKTSEGLRAEIWKRARINTLGMKFLEVAPGTFTMGPDWHRVFNRQPAHQVRLTRGYCISATEVTNAQFQRLFPDFKSDKRYSPDPDSPAVNVTWEMAVEFCRSLSQQEGVIYRLPTEAEWEYACRAGSTSLYCFGNNSRDLPQYGWIDESVGRASAVGLLKPNAWGIYDMHGNVFEWTSDWHAHDYYASCASKGVVEDPQGPETGRSHVLRSSPWQGPARLACTSAARFPRPTFERKPFDWSSPKMSQLIGFRVIRELDE